MGRRRALLTSSPSWPRCATRVSSMRLNSRPRRSSCSPSVNVCVVNENHAKVCPSPEWAAFIQGELLPRLTRDVELGPRMLEIGPGPGATTDWLRQRVRELTAVEIEPAAAAALRTRFVNTNVVIVEGDA